MYTEEGISMAINLSDSEWKLMSALWGRPHSTIMELTASVSPDTGWSKNTVITMLSRLEGKGAVGYDTDGRARRYVPRIAREDAARTETENFLDKVYGGSLGLMMNAMVNRQALTEEELAELSAILERAKEAQG